MKNIIVILLSVTICIGGYSQNRNAETIEDLCVKYGELVHQYYPKNQAICDSCLAEIGKCYIAGVHPEYLEIINPEFKTDFYRLTWIAHSILGIRSRCHSTEYTYEEDMKIIGEYRDLINSTMREIEREYKEYVARKNSPKKEIDFKGIM